MATSHYDPAISLQTKPFWKFTSVEVDKWVRQLKPGVPNTGGVLFPKRIGADATTTNAVAVAEFKTKSDLGNRLLQNLIRSLASASNNSNSNSNKKQKTAATATPGGNNGGRGDAYQILDPSFAKSGGESGSELSPGAILSRITLGGLVNGLAGVEGGVVDTLTCIPLGELNNNGAHNMDEASRKEENKKRIEGLIATAANLPLKQVIHLARGLHRSIAAR